MSETRDAAERYREWMALWLYGELEPDEEAELERYLAGSASGRAEFERLETTLGPLARRSAETAPPGTAAPESTLPRPRTSARLVPAAIGFAAGLLVMGLVTLGPFARRSEPAPRAAPAVGVSDRLVRADEDAPRAFGRDTPPPPATGRGALTQVASYLRQRGG